MQNIRTRQHLLVIFSRFSLLFLVNGRDFFFYANHLFSLLRMKLGTETGGRLGSSDSIKALFAFVPSSAQIPGLNDESAQPGSLPSLQLEAHRGR